VPVAPTALEREAAACWREVHRTGRPRGAHDLIIAATSVSSERTLLTTDARGFEDLPGVEVRILER
jgi:predicted nucleic acid-binding protein